MGIQDGDAAYYRMREEQELGRADEATLEEVRSIHLMLAEKYRSLAVESECQMIVGIEGRPLNGASKSV